MSDLEMKSFGPFEIKNEAKGEVRAIVATLNVVDKDGDVILPGAVPPGGARVKLSGYGHSVITENAPPAGKGVITEQGDYLVFDGKFFMSTDHGRNAFHTTQELGPEGEWSFGFPKAVKTAQLTDEWRTKGAKRLITGMDAIEASPVFVGAGWGTGTLLTKAAEPETDEPVAQADGDPAEPVAAGLTTDTPVALVVAVAGDADGNVVVAEPAEPVESAEEKAAREADLAYKAARAEAMEEFERVQRALRRMGYAA